LCVISGAVHYIESCEKHTLIDDLIEISADLSTAEASATDQVNKRAYEFEVDKIKTMIKKMSRDFINKGI
jgi:hypothetical protein